MILHNIFFVYGERKNLIDFLMDIAQSDNIDKHELMKFILQCVLNNSTSKRLEKQIKNKPIDDYVVGFLL